MQLLRVKAHRHRAASAYESAAGAGSEPAGAPGERAPYGSAATISNCAAVAGVVTEASTVAGAGEVEPRDARLRQRPVAMVDPHVPIDVRKPSAAPRAATRWWARARPRGGPPAGGQPAEFTAHRLHLRCAVQAEHPAQIARAGSGGALGPRSPQMPGAARPPVWRQSVAPVLIPP